MHNPEPFLKNKAHNFSGFWDANGSPHLGQITKLCRFGWPQIYLSFSLVPKSFQKTKKSMKRKSDGDTNCNWCTWNNLQRFGKVTRKLRNKRTSWDHPEHSIIKDGQNTGRLRRLAVTQIPVKDHQLPLVLDTIITKARIDQTQQNSKCGDRDKTINHIISKCSKLVQTECKTRHDWVGKMIHWEWCKKFNLTKPTKGICTTKRLS